MNLKKDFSYFEIDFIFIYGYFKYQYRSTGRFVPSHAKLDHIQGKVTRMSTVNHFETIHFENADIETIHFENADIETVFLQKSHFAFYLI